MRHALVPALLAALALPTFATPADEPKPLDAQAFAQRVEVVATPVHPFRYNQPIPTPNQTKPLLARRRAFFPGEAVTLSFRVPDGATLGSPVRARVALTLHDLVGAKLHDLGEAALSASDNGRRRHARLDRARCRGGPVPARRPLLRRGRPAARHAQQRRVRDARVPAAPRGGAGVTRPSAAEGRDGRRPRARRQPALDRDARRGRRDALVRLRPGAARLGVREAPAGGRRAPTPTDSRPARTRGRVAPAPSRRRTAPRSTARSSRTASTSRPPTTRRRRGRWWWACTAPARTTCSTGAGSSASATSRARGTTRPSARTSRSPTSGFVVLDALRPRRVGRLQRHRRGRRAAGHGPRPEGLQRGRRPRAPHRPVDGRRRHLAHRPALPRPLRLDLAGLRRRRPGPHALDGRLGRARPRADEPHRLHADRGERRQPAGLRLPRRRGRRGERDGVAEDDGGLREGRPRRPERPLLRAAGRHPLLVGLRLPRRLALPPRARTSAATPSRSASSTRPSRRATARPTGCASTGSTGASSSPASRARRRRASST